MGQIEMTNQFYKKRDTGDTKTLPLIGSDKSKKEIISLMQSRN